MLSAIKTEEGKEMLKTTLTGLYPKDVVRRLCETIDNGSNQKMKKLIKALFETFQTDGSREEKSKILLDAIL